MNTKQIQAKLAAFAEERDWDQFHSPKNLSTALMCEAGELAEIFQWMSGAESATAMTDPLIAEAIRDEIADVQLYLLRLADKLNIDVEAAMASKIAKNALKYPIEKSKGNAQKYSRRKE